MYKISAPKLKQIREGAKKTQQEMAVLMGVKNDKNVSSYENGHATPPANNLITLMIELGIQPTDIAEKSLT